MTSRLRPTGDQPECRAARTMGGVEGRSAAVRERPGVVGRYVVIVSFYTRHLIQYYYITINSVITLNSITTLNTILTAETNTFFRSHTRSSFVSFGAVYNLCRNARSTSCPVSVSVTCF